MKNTKRVLSVLLAVLIVLSLPLTANAVDSASHTVTLTQDSRVKYSSVQKETFEIKENAYRSIYAKSIDSDYYIDSISVNPEENADVSYNVKTGEVFIENVTSDITLTPVLKKNTTADHVDVKWELAGSGNYDEENPAAYVKFTASVKDSEGNPVVNTKVSLKADENDKSYSTSALTDKNGEAELKYSYGLGKYKAIVSSGDVSEEVSFNVVQQKKSDLELYTYQVQDSLKNTSTGSVRGLNPLYEYYTSPLHYAAIVVGSGEWESPDNGEIKNLSAGQYALRFKEHIEGDTIYLHSDYNYFTIGRAEWTVKADKDNSENVSFAADEVYAVPGGDVFYYVAPDDGYEISQYSVNKSSYISDISYNASKRYIRLSGVTGSVSLNVKAGKTQDTATEAVKISSSKILALKVAVSALGVSGTNEGLRITDVFQNTTGSEDGTKINFVIKGDEDFTSDNLPTLYYKLSTASKYSTAGTRNFTVNDDGSVTGYFTVSASATAGRVYDAYAELGGEETDHVTLNLDKRPSITKTDVTVTNEKGDRANGTITVNKADYIDGRFIYYKQGSSDYFWSDSNVITGLEHGTWYVSVAPYLTKTDENTYTVQVKSSAASVSVVQDDDDITYYTVKFVNAAGETVSEKEYEEGTKASAVTVPANTADYTDGNKVYSYSWGEITNVTSDKTYNEIETVSVKKTAAVSITNVSQNNTDGNYLSFELSLKGENGDEIEVESGVKVYVDGTALRGNINGSEFVGTSPVSQGTHSVYAVFSNDEYVESKSKEITVNLTRAEKPELSQTPDINASGKGTITITSPYSKFVYYRQGSLETVTENKLIEDLYGSDDSHVSALYYVYVPAQAVEGDADYNFLLPSDKATITVENNTEEESEPATDEATEATEPSQPSEPVTEPAKKTTKTEITDIYQRETNNVEGKTLIVKVKVTDEDGNAVYEDISGYNVTLSHVTSTNGKLNQNGEIEFTVSNIKEGNTVFTAYFNGTDYVSSQSEPVSVGVIKAAKPELSSTPDL
ncbi:MAG: Ig-like domain-containing protein, partial [Ruminococcus sp.]|nr:Ig-like domain-containing protein [Ruminococcus sp.]